MKHMEAVTCWPEVRIVWEIRVSSFLLHFECEHWSCLYGQWQTAVGGFCEVGCCGCRIVVLNSNFNAGLACSCSCLHFCKLTSASKVLQDLFLLSVLKVTWAAFARVICNERGGVLF